MPIDGARKSIRTPCRTSQTRIHCPKTRRSQKSITSFVKTAVMETNKHNIVLLKLLIILIASDTTVGRTLTRRSFADPSVKGYLTERTCWWNEVCKEEFQSLFRCKCPAWSFCRAPGRYYNAFCSMTATGYIWTQPGLQEAAAT